jgi:uncharacterized protein (TIGR03067 family)
MRRPAIVGAVIAILLAAQGGTPRAAPGTEAEAEAIARLIKQLGDDAFARREAATGRLKEIGEPALEALRQAAASDSDPEIRARAERIVQAIAAVVTNRELKNLQGTWILVSRAEGGQVIRANGDGTTMTYTGNQWAWKNGGTVAQAGTWNVVATGKTATSYNRHVTEGFNLGAGAMGIFRLEGDTFQYCEGPSRPKDFATKRGDGCYCCTWKRAKK